jgi:hypothetical protein
VTLCTVSGCDLVTVLVVIVPILNAHDQHLLERMTIHAGTGQWQE